MDVGRHPNIELMTLAQVVALTGKAGNFTASVQIEPRYVNEDLCTGCGDCERVCPQPAANAWDLGLGTRKAIYRPYPQAVPAAYSIDMESCLNSDTHFVCERCRRHCKTDAIEHDMKPKLRSLNVGSVIVATGFDEFHPHVMKSYGYGVWQNVMTSLEFERLLNASGPTAGHVIRPSDKQVPKNIAFIQCVGARGEGGRPNCSRYCCMNAVKDALLIKQHIDDFESCSILYTDLRAFGKGFDRFVERAKEEDYINFVRGRPSKLMEVENDDIMVFYEDTEQQKQIRLRTDMVVLSCAGVARTETIKLAETLRIQLNEIGFFSVAGLDHPVETSREGVFLCGSASGPQVIPECVAQASAAASKASVHVLDHQLPEIEPPAITPIDPHAEPRIGVFVCKCGANIGRVVKTDELALQADSLGNVVYSGVELFACADSGQKAIQEKIQEHQLNRVVIAACTPRTHEPVFRNACQQSGLNPYLMEMANIRDQCTWVHAKTKDKAFGKAIDLIRMSVARAAYLKPLEVNEVSVSRDTLVIGGGIAGMQAALDLEARGLGVTLIEAGESMGGIVDDLHDTFPISADKGQIADALRSRVLASSISVHTKTRVKNVKGFVGNFEVFLEADRKQNSLAPFAVGAIVVAIGSNLYTVPKSHHLPKKKNVITSLELEQMLGSKDAKNQLEGVQNVTFIQCVGSRRDGDGYPGCSRYCCPTTVKQANKLMAMGKNPVVLYRDMRMVGHGAEEFYRETRKKGALFLRYELEKPPQLHGNGSVERISYHDPLLRREVTLPSDLVVLAVGMTNNSPETEELRTLLKIPKGEDGFFLERHPELGPVETCIDGVFLAGTIQGPKDIADSIVQASAAAGKAAELLGRDRIYLEPVVCEVDSTRCRACGECVSLCEYTAPQLVEQENGVQTAEINQALCKGCGTCAVFCPTNAINACHFTDEQITSMITALFEDYHV
jgi:heterodisulfide reductase subunit A2